MEEEHVWGKQPDTDELLLILEREMASPQRLSQDLPLACVEREVSVRDAVDFLVAVVSVTLDDGSGPTHGNNFPQAEKKEETTGAGAAEHVELSMDAAACDVCTSSPELLSPRLIAHKIFTPRCRRGQTAEEFLATHGLDEETFTALLTAPNGPTITLTVSQVEPPIAARRQTSEELMGEFLRKKEEDEEDPMMEGKAEALEAGDAKEPLDRKKPRFRHRPHSMRDPEPLGPGESLPVLALENVHKFWAFLLPDGTLCYDKYRIRTLYGPGDASRIPVHCRLCPNRELHRRGLLQHFYGHHELKTWPCSLCNKGYMTKQALDRHVAKKHTEADN